MLHNADWSIREVLRDEGGYVNHPADNGGPTNKGITLANFRRYIKPRGTIADLKALTIEQAVDVYKQRYWNAVRADELPSGIDYAVFDFGVLSGPYRAIQYMQRVLQARGLYAGDIDGKIGPMTLKGIRSIDPRVFIEDYCNARLAYYKRLDDWPVFGNGWTNRIAGVRRDALNLVETTPAVVKQDFWTWLSNLLHSWFKRK